MLLDFDELPAGAQISIQTNDRGVLSGTAVPGGGTGALNPLQPQPSSLQVGLIVDPTNTTGVASASGNATATVDTVTGRVFDSWANLVAAWGTTAPVFNVNTQIVFASPNVATDPVYFTPRSTTAISLTMRAPLTAGPQGIVLAGVVAKNRATNVLLQADLGAGVSQGMLLVNTTRGNSVSHVDTVVAGTVFNLQQPLTPLAPPASPFTGLAEVDTWANGDVVNAFSYVTVIATTIVPDLSGISPTGGVPFCNLYRLNLIGVNASGQIQLGQVNLEETQSQTALAFSGAITWNAINHYFRQGFNSRGASWIIAGGGAQGGSLVSVGARGATLDGDFIMRAALTAIEGFLSPGLLYIGTGALSIVMQGGRLTNANGLFGAKQIYGSAGSNINLAGMARAFVSGGTFTAAWTAAALVSPGIQLNGSSTGSAEDGGAPTTINGGIGTTVAHLDAAFGVAGFGGTAFHLGGAAVTNVAA